MINSITCPSRLIIGFNSINSIQDVLKENGIKAPIIITSEGRITDGSIEILTNLIGKVKIFAIQGEGPTEKIVLEATQYAIKNKCDFLIGFGGGTCLDATKIISILAKEKQTLEDITGENKISEKGFPFLLIPTTAGSGSEGTHIAIYRNLEGLKKAVISTAICPDFSIVDPSFTLSLPMKQTVSGGLDALVHAIEAYTSNRSNSITDLLATQAIELLINNLPDAVQNPNNTSARINVSKAATLAGIAETNAGVGVVHSLAYQIENYHYTPHGITNGVILAPALRHIFTKNDKFQTLCNLFSADFASDSLSSKVNLFVNKVSKNYVLKIDLTDEQIMKYSTAAHENTRLMKNVTKNIGVKELVQIYKEVFQ